MNTDKAATATLEKGRIDRAGIGFVDIAALFCTIIVGTRFEFPAMAQGPGLALAIRLAAALIVLTIYVARGSQPLKCQNAIFIFLICYYFTVINLHEYSYFTFMATVAMAWGLSMATMAIPSWSRSTDFLLSGYMVFHLVGLGLAIVLKIVLGEFIDLHNILFPFSASRGGDTMNVTRLTGFHVEPGTYANYIYLFVLLRALLTQRILSRLSTIAMMSTTLTSSAWAIIAILCYFAAGLTEVIKRKRKGQFPTEIFVMCALTFFYVIVISVLLSNFSDSAYVKYIAERLFGQGPDASRADKIIALEQWRQAIGGAFVFGYPMSETFCPTCRSPQDIGVAFNLAFNFGVVPSVALWVMLFVSVLRKWGPRFLVLSAPLLVNKAFFYDPLIWFVIGIILLSPMAAAMPPRACHRRE